MLLNDLQITKLVKDYEMISPFIPKSIKEATISNGCFDMKKVISYGLSSFGYDLRVKDILKYSPI